MGGGLMQLVAYGAQDIYLTGNPQITFFKVVYRRHTNFSMEEIAQTPNGSVSFGGTASFTISRNGDLVHKMYFEFSPLDTISGGNFKQGGTGGSTQSQMGCYMGNSLLKEIECEIGGQKIDRHYGHWLSTWADLTEPNPCGEIGQIHTNTNTAQNTAGLIMAEPGMTSTSSSSVKAVNAADGALTTGTGGRSTKFQRMSFNHFGIGIGDETGTVTAFTNTADDTDGGLSATSELPKKAHVPLRFWFNRNPGLALPLIALQYHEVKINIKFCDIIDIFAQATGDGDAIGSAFSNVPTLQGGKLYAQYIYLDTDERRRFAQVSHEYLIEQLQFQNESSTNGTYTLNFNHPVKEIIWGGAPVKVGAIAGATTVEDAPVTGSTVLSPFASGDGEGTSNGVTKVIPAPSGDNTASAEGSNGSMGVLFQTQGGNCINNGTWQLKLNGHDRFEPRPITYFSRQQIYDHHTGYGCVPSKDSILVYSFALKPEEHQPSGTCNFSRIDTAQLIGTDVFGAQTSKGIYVYATNYNVLRIMSGMGGLAYSN
jgi:hypothetical protein